MEPFYEINPGVLGSGISKSWRLILLGLSGLGNYNWGQKDYLPNFYSRRILLGNCMSSCVRKRKSRGIYIE